MVTTLGCRTRPVEEASRWKRVRNSGSSSRLRCKSFSATGRLPTATCSARNTVPIPPEPSGRVMRYRRAKPGIGSAVVASVGDASAAPSCGQNAVSSGNVRWHFGQVRIKLFANTDSQRPHFTIKVAALESERFGRSANVALIRLQFAEDIVALIVFARVLECRKSPATGASSPRRRPGADLIVLQGRGQVTPLDPVAGNHNHEALHQVLQFSDVARPAIMDEHLDGSFGKV